MKSIERVSVKLTANVFGSDDRNSRQFVYDGSAYCQADNIQTVLGAKLNNCIHQFQALPDDDWKLGKDESLHLQIELHASLMDDSSADVEAEDVEYRQSLFPDSLAEAKGVSDALGSDALRTFFRLFIVVMGADAQPQEQAV